MRLLNFITIILSSIHFSNDNFINIPCMFFILISLLYYGSYKWSQYIALFYMSFIHTPLHFYRLQLSTIEYIIPIFSFIIIYKMSYLNHILITIIQSGGKQPNSMIHKLLLGIINAHIICNLLIT